MKDHGSRRPPEQGELTPNEPCRGERRPVQMVAVATLENGSEVPVSIVDLSYDGCAINTPVALTTGEPIYLAVRGRGKIHAEVRWYADGKAGLLFKREAPAAHTAYVPRKGERVDLATEVTMRRLGKIDFRVRVIDASMTGCKVQFVDRPMIGEQVLLKFSNLQVLTGTVRWIDGVHAGIEFDHPIHPAVFDLVVERSSAEKSGGTSQT